MNEPNELFWKIGQQLFDLETIGGEDLMGKKRWQELRGWTTRGVGLATLVTQNL